MADYISFDTIPGSIRVPGRYIEFNTRNAVQGLPQNPQKLLLLAPMTDGGWQARSSRCSFIRTTRRATCSAAGRGRS